VGEIVGGVWEGAKLREVSAAPRTPPLRCMRGRGEHCFTACRSFAAIADRYNTQTLSQATTSDRTLAATGSTPSRTFLQLMAAQRMRDGLRC
jgi:hypothetical protein